MAATGGRSRSVLTRGEMEVARELVMHGPASRGDLGERLEISTASITRLTRSLLDGGVLTEGPPVQASAGRPARLLNANPGARLVVGVKLTAGSAYAVLCDLLGEVLVADEAPLPGPGPDGSVPVAGAVDTVVELARRLAGRRRLDGICVSLGGVVRPDGVVEEATFLGWRGIDLQALLAARMRVPVRVTNDVIALAREQLWFGAGRTHSTFAVITVGAGIGYGLVREGRVVDQLIDNGHLLLHAPVDGRPVRCSEGHRGCVSAYLDRPSIERRAGDALGTSMSYDEVVALSDDGDRRARRILDDAASALAHLVCTVAGGLQTTRIALGGESIAPLTARPTFTAVITERPREEGVDRPRCTLDISTVPHTFTEWARGAAVTAVQHVLGAH